ncbi:universal stress protein [Halobium salinum]|uniref:Universal stress protein n=1 Tax=Halobium salinum TaxID=1364940 RepID=A0ABD5PB58_9EURY|nr:universal stress protein [Halobium salinum]
MSTTAQKQRTTGLETVLVAVGASDENRVDRIVEEAIDVAGPADATVVLAHVFSEEEYAENRERLDFSRDSEATPDVVARRHSTLRELAKQLEDAGVEYEVRGIVGDRGKAIVDLAGETEADRVLVGGRKRSPTGKAVFGSTAQEVILSSPCPVTFVRADTE